MRPLLTLPAAVGELTPARLSCWAPTVDVEVLDRAVATNQRGPVALTYADPGPTASAATASARGVGPRPASLSVKLPPLDPALREMISASGMRRRRPVLGDRLDDPRRGRAWGRTR